MNKTLNINLAGFIFHMDEEAFFRLEKYLNTLKRQFENSEGGKEIISDIETRIAELFKEKTSEAKEVISLADVDQVIAVMGQPEDYIDPDLGESSSSSSSSSYSTDIPYQSKSKRIFRDPDNKILGGVASGLAAYFNIDSLWMRLAFILLFILSGFGLALYLIMWLVTPKAQTTAEKLQMRGEHINISNIEKSIKDEMGSVNQSVRDFGERVSSYSGKRTKSHLSSFFSDLSDFILDALRLIFKVIGKIFGLFFLFLGFAILIGLVAGLFAGGVNIVGSNYSYSDLFSFLQIVTVSSGHYNLMIVGLTLSVIAPFFLLVYLGIRLLFNLEPLNRPARSALAFTTFLGLVFLLIAGIRIGLEFDRRAEVTKNVALGASKHYHLQLPNDTVAEHFKDAYVSNWLQSGDKNIFSEVELEIYTAKGDEAYIKYIISAGGNDRRQARYNARETNYEVIVSDSVITIPNYYVLSRDQKYRGQDVTVQLFLPVGHSIYINNEMGDILEHAKNVQSRWEDEMVDTKWIMTEDGLNCEGCEIPEPIEEELIEQEDENGSLELRIDEDGIEINIDEGENDEEGVQMKITQQVMMNASYYIQHLLPFKNESYVMI